MSQESIELNIRLTVKETNYILATLGKQPYDDVYSLIAKIKVQGDSQLNAMANLDNAD